MKTCLKCDQPKPNKQFYRRKNKLQSYCKECKRQIDRKTYLKTKDRVIANKLSRRKRLTEWFNGLKDKPCTDCGNKFHHSAMQWDHLPGTEKLCDLADVKRDWSKEKILKEIAKCELVCANCHAVRTYNRNVA